ncbi:MAG: motility associated factor glycosyltransferase family protein [Candidatus Omnitrophica bacterium]|nr:motility associated factor glycosyltransferase family protein [Candidatus Omnitrophota bacterium]
MNRNTVFEKNMEVLEKRYPDLAKRVRETDDNPSYKIIQAKNGKPNVLIKKGSEFFMLYDNDDPEKYCEQYLESLKINYAPVVVFMGLGLGYHLDRYFKLLGEKVGTRQIVVFEKDIELFRLALTLGDFVQVFAQPNIHFFVGESPEEIYVKLKTEILSKNDIRIALKSLKVIPLPANIALDEQYYKDVFLTLRNAARQIMVLTGNDSLDSFAGLENILKNLKHIFSNPGINTLYDKFRGRPAVLVAAGPSLNKNMHLLRGLEDKALIISCDASFIPVMKKGIRPHLVTSLERTPGVDLFYTGIENFSGIYFIALPILMPKTIDVFKGRKFIAYRGYSHFDWLEEEKGTLNVGISVANLAFQILVGFGCDPIILIGQDLAYAEDGDTHVKGDIFGSRVENVCENPVVELEGNDGKPIKSRKLWEIMKYTYEEDIAAYKGTCINATEGGAKILGAEVMPFKNAIEKYCMEVFNPNLILDEAYSNFTKDSDVQEKIKKIQKKAKVSDKMLRDSIEKFHDALEMANQAEKEIIKPFLENDSEYVDMERLTSVEQRFLDLSKLLGGDKDYWALMAHTLSAYDICYSNEMGFLRDIYTDETCLAMARVRKIKDWFAVVGQFLVLTENILKKTEKRLGEEIAL